MFSATVKARKAAVEKIENDLRVGQRCEQRGSLPVRGFGGRAACTRQLRRAIVGVLLAALLRRELRGQRRAGREQRPCQPDGGVRKVA